MIYDIYIYLTVGFHHHIFPHEQSQKRLHWKLQKEVYSTLRLGVIFYVIIVAILIFTYFYQDFGVLGLGRVNRSWDSD